MELKAWEPIDELQVIALDSDCNYMKPAEDLEPGEQQRYGCTVIGFCLDDPEGCRSIVDITTGEGREADEALAALVVRSLRAVAGHPPGGCPYCFSDILYCDRHDQAKSVAHCDDCGAELTMEQYREGLSWVDRQTENVSWEKEALLEIMESAANMLRGMTLDPAIPMHAKLAMTSKITELEAAVELALKSQ